MKIRSAVFAGIAIVVSVSISVFLIESAQTSQENKIRVAFFPNIGHLVPIIGLETGMFSNSLGNQTTIETHMFDSGPQVIESLFAKSIDFAYVGPGPTLQGFVQSEKSNLKILAGAASGGASFIVHPKSEINSVSDLSGKRIAAPPIGNTQDVSLRTFLSQNGLNSAEKGGSVVVLNTANAEIFTLFAKGDIDAAWVPEPWATILIHELNGTRLFHEEDLWPNKQFASVLLIGRTDYIENNPPIVKSWIDSNNAIVSWINNNPEETKIIFQKFIKKELGRTLPENIISESFSNIEITSDPIIDSIYIFAKRADALGYLGRHGYDLDGIFYNTILQGEGI
jgi:NitT/TauT family transport system substrate-binding protein